VIGNILAGLLSPYLDLEDVEAERMTAERTAEATKLDEMLAEQESMRVISRLDDDIELILYQSPAPEWWSEQTGFAPGMETMLVSVGKV
jgi:hypothetical protein